MGEAWIIDAVRTPRGRGKAETGALSGVHAQELFATTLNALVQRNGLNARDVEDVVVGCVTQTGEQGGCVARMAVLGFHHLYCRSSMIEPVLDVRQVVQRAGI